MLYVTTLRGVNNVVQLRDPIHGFIDITEGELLIIDSQPFQRLRNIKQLATTYLVYPGAEHTRFGHSIGVMHLVSKAFDNALENYEKRNNEKLFDDARKKWYRQILRLIALTHDLGHAPFSHASEYLFDGRLEHEDYTQKIIFETEISGMISEIGEKFKEEHGDEYHITPELLWMIYGEKNPELNPDYRMPDYKFLKSFMDSEIDCDKMDYLLRDSYYCGVSYGKFDLNRLLSTLNVYKKDNVMQLAVERGGLHAFEEFVIARYFMFIQVYFHKTRRYLDKLLIDCIRLILPDQKFPTDVQEYLAYDDYIIWNEIRNAEKQGEQTAEEFLKREVKSCVYETKIHNHGSGDINTYQIIKRELNRIEGIEIYEDTANKSPHKIPVIESYDSNSGKGIPILVNHIDRPHNLLEESLLLQSLDHPINIKRIYVGKEHAEKAREMVHSFLNFEEV